VCVPTSAINGVTVIDGMLPEEQSVIETEGIVQFQESIAPGSGSVNEGIEYTSEVNKGTVIESVGVVQEGGLLTTEIERD
jgi:hypothetical protein